MLRSVPLALLLALFFAALPAAAQNPEIGQPAPAFTLTDTNGRSHRLQDFNGKYVVLEWLNFDCPFVQKHYRSGNMQALQQRYTAQEVVWLAIVSSAPGKQGHFPPAQMNARNQREGGRMTAILMDPTGEVGQRYGARTTPHMFVIAPNGRLVYKGAIDNRPTANQRDVEGATNYVAAALDAHRAGRPVATTTSLPYGCSVKY